MKTHEYVGWGVIVGALAFFLIALVQLEWAASGALFAMLPVTALIFALLVVPGVIILKKKWSALASVMSGVVAFALFVSLIPRTNAFAASIIGGREGNHFFPLLALLAGVLPLVLSVWLYRKLKAWLVRILPRDE